MGPISDKKMDSFKMGPKITVRLTVQILIDSSIFSQK